MKPLDMAVALIALTVPAAVWLTVPKQAMPLQAMPLQAMPLQAMPAVAASPTATVRPAKAAWVPERFGCPTLREAKRFGATVRGAGSSVVNGFYPPSLSCPHPYNGAAVYENDDGPPILLYRDNVGHWCLSSVPGYQPGDGVFYYGGAEGVAEGGAGESGALPANWSAESGALPVPTVTLGAPPAGRR